MTQPEQALAILDNASALALLNAQDRNQVNTAVQILNQFLQGMINGVNAKAVAEQDTTDTASDNDVVETERVA